jgi:hypothetical protein
VTAERRRKLRRPDVYRLVLALASLLSIAGATRFAAPHHLEAMNDLCPRLRLTVNQRGGIVVQVCGFVPGAPLLFPIRYDLTLRLQVRADQDSSADGP